MHLSPFTSRVSVILSRNQKKPFVTQEMVHFSSNSCLFRDKQKKNRQLDTSAGLGAVAEKTGKLAALTEMQQKLRSREKSEC